MHNVIQVLRRDVLRLARVPLAWIILIGIVVTPALYAWFTTVAFWNPYGNTQKISVAVVNDDAGTHREHIGSVAVGAQVVDELHHNDQLGWHVVGSDQAAIDEVRSGRSYAAIVIPRDFSARLLTVLDGDFTQPAFDYYVNEKKNAIAPKVTDVGASTVDRKINSTFVAAVSKVAVGKLTDISDLIHGDAAQAKQGAIRHLRHATSDLSAARRTLRGVSDDIGQAEAVITDSYGTLRDADRLVASTQSNLDRGGDLISSLQRSVNGLSDTMFSISERNDSVLSQVSATANASVGRTSNGILRTQERVNGALDDLQQVIDVNTAVVDRLQRALDSIPESSETHDVRVALQSRIDELKAQDRDAQNRLDAWRKTSRDIDVTASAAANASQAVDGATQGTAARNRALRDELANGALPKLNGGMSGFTSAVQELSASLSGQRVLIAQFNALLHQLDATLNQARSTAGKTDTELAGVQSDLNQVTTDVEALGSAATWRELSRMLDLDAGTIARFMGSPTALVTRAVYPVNTYGSAMAPLFTSLSLWIGAFVLVVILKLEADDEGIPGLTVAQGYVGRLLLLAGLAVIQAVVVCVGDLIIGVQTVNPVAFVLTGVLAGLTYLSIIFALSISFAHVGKALCVVLVIMQIPGASGIYPIEMMPMFFRRLSGYLPFTYGINAMRETIGGFYDGYYWQMLGRLMLFMVGAFALGIGVRPYLTNLNSLFSREIEQGDLFVGEWVRPSRASYRLSQMIKALTDREEYRYALIRRARGFALAYPRLKRGALVVGIAVPVGIAILASFNVGSKLMFLAVWVIWILLMIGFLMVIEFLRDSIERQLTLSDMDDVGIRSLFVARTALRHGRHRGSGRHA